LGIEPIFAMSPQAKGRVERLFNTLQDRLVQELPLRTLRRRQRRSKIGKNRKMKKAITRNDRIKSRLTHDLGATHT
jgi:hypothetical protein